MSLITNIATGTGTVTITSSSHGLANGNTARITNTNCTPCIDGFYEVSNVSGSNFDISATVTVAGNSGNCGKTFFLDQEAGNDSNDGLSFANRWKTITSGATAARIAPDDFIRIKASPAAVSLGQNASFTNLSKDVVLTTAVTKDLCTCEVTTNWTGATNCTVAVTSTMKQGSYAIGMTCNSSFTTGKLATYDLYAANSNVEQDLSSYQNISFWLRCNNSAIAFSAGDLKLKLYSDSAGTVEVDSIDLPALTAPAAQYIPITLKKGSALSSTVRSMALYANVSVVSKTFYIDNIFACNGLHLQCLIGKNVAPTADYLIPDPWYCVQSIVGTTIKIDNETTCASSAGRGYTGTTESVTLYYRETTQTAMAAATSTVVAEPQDYGLVGRLIAFSGGWNTTDMSSQDGVTFFDGLNGCGVAFKMANYIAIERLFFVRYYDVISIVNYYSFVVIKSCGCISVTRRFSTGSFNYAPCILMDVLVVNSCVSTSTPAIQIIGPEVVAINVRAFGCLTSQTSAGFAVGQINVSALGGTIKNIVAKNGAAIGVGIGGESAPAASLLIDGLVTADNASASIGLDCTAQRVCIKDFTYNEASLAPSSAVISRSNNPIVHIRNKNSDGLSHAQSHLFEIHEQTSVIHTPGRTGFSIKALETALKLADMPNWYPLGPFKALANRACIISMWMQRTSTALSLGIRIRADGRVPGIGSTNKGILAVGTSYNKYEVGTYEGRSWVALANAAFAPVQSANWDYDLRSMMTAAADTWERVSLTFTPTADCLFEPEVICYTTDASKSGYFHEMTITQY